MSNTLWESVLGALRADIVDTHMRVGDRFPSRDEICSRFNVSTITAKRAIDELEAEGWVKKYKYRGTFIARNVVPVSVSLILDCLGHTNMPNEINNALSSFPRLMGIVNEFQRAAERIGVDLQVLTRMYGAEMSGQNLILLQGEDISREDLQPIRRQNNIVLTHMVESKECASTVRIDMKKGAKLVVKHLVSLGHKRIGLVLARVTDVWQIARLTGYEEVLKRNGIAFEWRLVRETINLGMADIRNVMDRLMWLDQPPTAIFAGNDEIALTIMQYCREKGIDVPGKLSVIGFDNNSEASIMSPGLTTIDNRLDLMAEESLRIIVEADGGHKEIQDVVIPPELVIRESTAPPAI
ncbi:MAG: GntR family transcriptional regulator [bacterium]|nr:GntR family transcriptional regulator [bacterium]